MEPTDRPPADVSAGPLTGLLVADFSRILAGPYASMLLADLGAEVVKVEGPGGDDTRTWMPPVRDGEASYYLSVNRNKRSVALDFRDDHDAALARELAGRADIVLENFRTGGLARFGLDYDSVAATNPAVIDASITGFGPVPVYTNIFAPPLPQPKRFVQLGRLLRELVESWPSDKRVAIVGTGHLSLELGGPRQFGPHGPDPEFDQRAVEWIANGDPDGCLSEVTLDSLHAPGNATHGFMDFTLMMGVAGENAKADYVDTYDLFHTMEAYFTWYPNGVPE